MKAVQKARGATGLIVIVITDERLADLIMLQQLLGLACIFAGYLRDFFAENSQGAEGNVLQVADGGGDEIESGSQTISSVSLLKRDADIIR